MKRLNIAAVLMVCNEEKRIAHTLESIRTSVTSLIVYDTGSQDNTVSIIKEFSHKHALEFYLLEGTFVDFETSRNLLLEFADKINNSETAAVDGEAISPENAVSLLNKNNKFDYLLLLDSNDEYQGENSLDRELIKIIMQNSDALDEQPPSSLLETDAKCLQNTDELLTPEQLSPLQLRCAPEALHNFKTDKLSAQRTPYKPFFETNKFVCFKLKTRKRNKKLFSRTPSENNNASSSDSLAPLAHREAAAALPRVEGATALPRVEGATPDAFMIRQNWFIGREHPDLNYYNIRVIKPGIGYKYKGKVHEYLVDPPNIKIITLPDTIRLYQDRVADNDGKTKNRWKRDVEVLKQDLREDPTNSRNQYYLAQTYECLGDVINSFTYFQLRAKNTDGFYEERFISMLKCGYFINKFITTFNREALDENLKSLDLSDEISWYLKAYELINHAEPLINLAKIYRNKQQFLLAYHFSKMACKLDLPNKLLLHVNQKVYTHDRWQELGISAFYVNKFKIGEEACRKAIATGLDTVLNEHNLSFYTRRTKLLERSSGEASDIVE